MPIQQCQVDGKQGWRWGKQGKCYIGKDAKKKAIRQALAITKGTLTENRTQIVPSNPLKADPTRTATLRRLFERVMAVLFARLRGRVLRLVVDEDAFGIRREHRVDVLSNVGNDGAEVTLNVRWRSNTDAEKVKAFQQWFATQVQMDVLQGTIDEAQNAYYQKFVDQGYRKGAGRAFDDTRKAALHDQGAVSDFYQGTKDEFLRSSFAHPVAIDRIKQLTGRVFTELQGVNAAMASQLTRSLADGLAQGKNLRVIAREINKTIDGIGRRRAQIIARTEIIRAHAEGQLDAMERLGVVEIGVMVEWSTAGDDRVCAACADLDGVVLKVKEARGILPRHPNCRCCYIPANVGETTVGQKRSKTEVQRAFDKSIRREIPKIKKRTLAQQKAMSRWGSADLRIGKVRPKPLIEPKPIVAKPKPPTTRREAEKQIRELGVVLKPNALPRYTAKMTQKQKDLADEILDTGLLEPK